MSASAKEVKSFLKEKGIDTKNIRVSSGSSIEVKLLDPKLDYDLIESLLKEEFESIHRDDATGEILSGGNTFVFLEYDYDLIKEIQEELRPTIRPFLEKCSGRWDIPALVKHYVETQPLDYNIRIVKRAIQEALYLFLKENPEAIEGLSIGGWN
jgi:hypothetical protein